MHLSPEPAGTVWSNHQYTYTQFFHKRTTHRQGLTVVIIRVPGRPARRGGNRWPCST